MEFESLGYNAPQKCLSTEIQATVKLHDSYEKGRDLCSYCCHVFLY